VRGEFKLKVRRSFAVRAFRALQSPAKDQDQEFTMPYDENGRCPGHIEGLFLPPNAWHALRRGNITTLAKLRKVADHLEQFDGFGPKLAGVIRAELARISPPDPRQSSNSA